MLKKIGTDARKDIEEFIGKKAFLEIYVKVNKEWRIIQLIKALWLLNKRKR